MLTIDIDTARRYILGKQGLWPGRRWRGLPGAAQAMTAIEYLQLDPLQIIARSHDIQLHSRVLDYTPGLWEEATYRQRKFFDWGGWLAVRPLDELPHWRVVMRREREGGPDVDTRIHKMAHEHAGAIDEVRAILRERGAVSNRDFEMATRTRTQSYRGRKDSALALYYLWRTGEVMTHHRENFVFRHFNRLYDKVSRTYVGHIGHAVTHAPRWMTVFALLAVLCGFFYTRMPGSFLPEEDQGYALAMVQLPSGATLDRTLDVFEQVRGTLEKQEGFEGMMQVAGFSFMGQGENVGMAFVREQGHER